MVVEFGWHGAAAALLLRGHGSGQLQSVHIAACGVGWVMGSPSPHTRWLGSSFSFLSSMWCPPTLVSSHPSHPPPSPFPLLGVRTLPLSMTFDYLAWEWDR